jgi:hypothetical protein
MTVTLTPEILAGQWEVLRLTKPFAGWRLPHADDVEFHVMGRKDRHGDYEYRRGRHIIRVSGHICQSLASLVFVLAHEACHMRLKLLGEAWRAHGAHFNALADEVCRHHPFERGQF